jgi:tetratricopeptide (TPR) repeat protein
MTVGDGLSLEANKLLDEAAEDRILALAYKDPAAALVELESFLPQDQKEHAAADLLRGISLYYAGDYSGSLRSLTQAEPGIDPGDDALRRLRLLRWRAQNYFRLAAFQDALPVALEALDLAERSGQRASLAQLQNVVAAIRLRTGDHGDALTYFGRAEQGFAALSMAEDRAKVLNNIAAVHIESNHLDLAEPPLLEALEVGRRLDRPTTVLASLVNLIELRSKQGRIADALDAVEACFASEQADAERRAKLWCHDAAVVATQAAGDLEESIDHARKAVEEAQALGLQSELISNATRLSSMLSTQGDLALALKYSEKVTAATAELNRALMDSRIEQIEALNSARWLAAAAAGFFGPIPAVKVHCGGSAKPSTRSTAICAGTGAASQG